MGVNSPVRFMGMTPGKTLAALLHSSRYSEIAAWVADDPQFLEQGGACLYIACENGRADVVHLLLRNGADPNYLGGSPLRVACRRGYTNIAEILLVKGADIHSENDRALAVAAQDGHCDTVRFLMARGANIHTFDNGPIRIAKRNGHKHVAALLQGGTNAPDLIIF